jgi:hypothetical protein
MDSAGAKSAMSNDMKELREGKEEITNEIRGHLANLSNPSQFLKGPVYLLTEDVWTANRNCHEDTSDKSKDHSKEELECLGGRDTLEAHRNKPISKSAAEELYGSRASAG